MMLERISVVRVPLWSNGPLPYACPNGFTLAGALSTLQVLFP